MMSKEHKIFLKNLKKQKIIIIVSQLLIIFLFLISWEILSRSNFIDSFIFSSPSKIIYTLKDLYNNSNLFKHIYITSIEVIISFIICSILSFLIALLLYIFPIIKKILDPFINLLNSLPKVALGPLIIIWIGANQKSIVFMALLINLIVTFTTMLNGFLNVDENKIKLFIIFKAKKIDILNKLIIPSAIKETITALKLNLSMSFIGVIMGEFLSCKAGLGYIILYGTQVFNLSLVMCGIFILLLLSFIFYTLINLIEKKLVKN